DRDEHSAWHFLRTTRSEGPIENRRWLRDGRFQPLSEQGDRVFSLPFDGWIFQTSPAESPAVAIASEDKAAGLAVQRGDVIVTPGPQHAVVVGWESPVSGTLEVRGAFEHAQSSTGVAWHVERGPAPTLESGFAPTPLATGRAVFGTATQKGEFAVDGLKVDVGDFLYFTVDAIANGTPTPHYGDGTRLDVTITVRNAVSPPPPSFERDVLPIFSRKCHDCHGADAREAKLDLRSLSEILRGGENGPALVRGEPHGSLLIDLVEKGQMPPGDHDKVTSRELALIRRWTNAGAPADEKVTPLPPHAGLTDRDREFWAFVPPRKTTEPPVRAVERVRSPIDRFLLARLEQDGLTFSPDADRQAFIRRASFDLLGLPPSPAAVQAFVGDSRPDAHERLIDELLKSPRYGERWGRHWLDAAGYVDGKLDNDLGTIYPHKSGWRYRDYVIQAFNDDMPFDRFLIEQIAGDELVDWRKAETFDARTVSLLTATGFLRTVDDHTDFPQYGIEKRYEVVNETLDMFSTAVLGLTIECCRCHNHKYDPLPQRDYYRLMACFEPAYNPHSWKSPKDRHLPDVSPAQIAAIDRHNAEVDRQIYEVSKRDADTRVAARKRLHDARLAALPDDLRNELKAALDQEPGQRTDAQKSLVAKHEPDLKITDAQIDAALTDAEKAELKKNSDERTALNAKKKSHGMIQALWDVGPPPPSHVHRRGNVKAHGVLV
ncbi:MAG TPA: DUF1549 domain-containing protein, partial [Pirellulaceae bacterium]|nr:DUF1549 domain-containing protein [Pirellulaceae bacterium]